MTVRPKIIAVFALLVAQSLYSQINPSDGCSGIPSLSVNSTCVANSYTLAGSYANGGLVISSCFTGNDRDDGWYQFVATGTTTDIDLTGNRDHLVSVWTSCAGGSELACDHATAGNVATVSFATTPGTTYYVQVHRTSSNNTSSMTGTICIHDPIVASNDCSTSVQVCSNSGFPGNSSGFGTQELNAGNRGCLNGNEHQSSWYLISIGTTGTLQFTISPVVASDDYDFAVWGPNSPCPPTSAPTRCSYSGTTGNTGVNTGLNGAESPQTSEGSGGNKYVDDMDVMTGEVYLLCIDNYNATTTVFNLTFGGSAGISCVPLPVELVSFSVVPYESVNLLEWITKSELNNDFFSLEKSTDGTNWNVISVADGSNNSSEELIYTYRDYDITDGWIYYQLWQTDNDGNRANLGVISTNNSTADVKLVRIVNLMGEEVDENYKGIRVYIYSDGSTVKRMSQ